ncbi:MAG: outer membrane protein assembly factor BamB family protein [Halobacteriota archaeon]
MVTIHIKKLAPLALVVVMVASICAGNIITQPKVAAQTAPIDTMQFRYNAAHTGDYSSVAGNSLSNGLLKWKYRTATGNAGPSTPAVVNNIVYFEGGNTNWPGIDTTIYAVSALTGEKVWSYTTGGSTNPAPAVANGVVYAGSGDTYVYALNAATGSLKWSYKTGNAVFSSPAVANGVVYVGSDDGNLYALNADTGALIWKFAGIGDTRSSPAIDNGVVYVGGNFYDTSSSSWQGKVYALDASTGAKTWDYTAGSGVHSSPTVLNGVVYLGSNDNKIYALNAATGSLKWSYTTGSSVFSSPAVAAGVVYIGSYDNKIYALDAATGSLKWSYTTGGQIYASPAIANGVVYVGSCQPDNSLYALSATTGAKLWSYTMGYNVYSPAVVSGVVYVLSGDGNLYAVGTQPTPPNNPPTADAGSDQSIHVGTLVTLDGSNSKDIDGTVASYAWTLVSSPEGSNPALSDPTAAKPTFTPDKLGSYTFALKVTDDKGVESTNTAQVTITATNDPPTANAGPDQTVKVKTGVTLDGRQSTDPNSDPITYTWTLVSKPHKSAAQLSGGTTAQPAFTPDKTGAYTFKLVVTDKYGAQSSDTVVVTANNSKPPKPHK